MSTLDEQNEVVEWFTKFMLIKLQCNSHKGGPEGWRQESISYLVNMLEQELRELKDSLLNKESSAYIQYEAADVANFAMMIADVVKQRGG